MIPLMFSIPVHENLEVVLDQIINYKFFNPECGIILHFSDTFDFEGSSITRASFEKALNTIENIFINPNTLRTEYADIIQAHISNFDYIKEKCEFKYFVLCASNELFIKHGLYQSIKGYDCGLRYLETQKLIEDMHKEGALKDPKLQAILQDIGGKKIITSQVEGTFFNKSLFSNVCEIINRNYNYKLMEIPYAREEFYFSTIVWNKKLNGEEINIYKDGVFTYMTWEHLLRIETDDIKRLQQDNNSRFFSVKRVSRELNDYIRCYIREESGYYHSEEQLFKSLSFTENSAYDARQLLPLPQFNGENILDILQEMINGLAAARDQNQERQFRNIVAQIEDKYRDDILNEISLGNTQVLLLLVQINEIVCAKEDTNQSNITPLRWIKCYLYENKLLKEICSYEKIMLYGAGQYGKAFLMFLRKNDLSSKVTHFVVSDSSSVKAEIDGVSVAALPNILLDQDQQTRIYITVHEKLQKEIEETLRENGYQNYEIVRHEFLQTLAGEPNCFWQEKKICDY